MFLGGALSWAREVARDVVSAAHTLGYGRPCRPAERVARWLLEVGVDSLDTSGVARRSAWDRLARLGRSVADGTRQATLG